MFAKKKVKRKGLKSGSYVNMKWMDVLDIAIELDDKYPETDPLTLNFLELKNMVIGLDGFNDDPERSSEKVLEAIQQSWIDERE